MTDKNWVVFPPLQQDAILVSLCLSVCAYDFYWVNICYFQVAGSNVIRCRKDGNWTGSFRLCPHSKGQCSLPQNLHYSLQYSCKRGHGIGLYAMSVLFLPFIFHISFQFVLFLYIIFKFNPHLCWVFCGLFFFLCFHLRIQVRSVS